MVDQYSPLERAAKGQMLMKRRSLLAGASGLALASLLEGCQRSNSASLRLAMLANGVPAQLLRAFQQRPEGEAGIAVVPQDSLAGLYGLLQRWQRQPEAAAGADWVSLADYWLAPAIRQGLVQPVETAGLAHWDKLATLWPDLVRRSAEGLPSAEGIIWAVPYRWSHLVLLYDPSRLPRGAELTTWADLLRPELHRRVILPDHPRLVLGMAQKALGASANSDDPAAIADLETFLTSLHQQVRVYDSDRYLEALIIGDASAVVAWSDDVQPLLSQYRHLAAAVPTEGTLLSAQLWVQPAKATPSPLAADWLDFCLEAEFADQLAIFSQGISPRLWGVEPAQLPEPLRRSPTLLSPQVASQSEFLLPLSEAAEAQYLALWQALRS